VLTGLAAVDTASGTKEDVAARIGAYIGWLEAAQFVPTGAATYHLGAPIAETQLEQFKSSKEGLPAFAASQGTAVFARPAKEIVGALSETKRRAQAFDSPGSITSRLSSASSSVLSSIGAPMVGVATVFFPFGASADGRLAGTLDAYAANLATQAIVIGTTGESAHFVQATLPRAIADRINDPIMRTVSTSLLSLPNTWETIVAMHASNIPIPLEPWLMRWEIELETYGIVAVKRGAFDTFYGKSLFSMGDDEDQQVTRGTLSFEAGVFCNDEKSNFHLRDVYINDCLGGMNCRFFEGGNSGDIQRKQEERGSIVVTLEPYRGRNSYPDVISAYGRWGEMMPFASDKSVVQFTSAAWLRKWFGVKNQQTQITEEEEAWSGERAHELLSMWRGGARTYNPAQMSWEHTERGAGPFASRSFYAPGMFAAWRKGEKYSTSTMAVAMAH
jgi:hypothetical protein